MSQLHLCAAAPRKMPRKTMQVIMPYLLPAFWPCIPSRKHGGDGMPLANGRSTPNRLGPAMHDGPVRLPWPG